MKQGSASGSGPIADAELGDLLAPLEDASSLVLAVSGGPDSMALMHLVACWLLRRAHPKPDVLVATVDHGLRAESAQEARWVARQAKKAGLRHETLVWGGEKPRSGVQEAAREARYRLLCERCLRLAEGRGGAVVTAHHLDDQAETFLMRLARGSGLDGLSGMVAARPFEPGAPSLRILRPLLGVPKARLLATLEAHGLGWIEDPSNQRTEFERVRIRKAMLELERLGITAERISESVGRLQRVREALDQAAAGFGRSAGLDVNGGAYASFDLQAFLCGPIELRVRMLARLLRAFGGQAEPPRLTKIEALAQRIASTGWKSSTLGGCVIARHGQEIRVMREPGRAGLPQITLAPGERAVWDRRFVVHLSSRQEGPVEVRALGPEGHSALAAMIGGNAGLPVRAAATLPAFVRAGTVIAVPQLRWPIDAAKVAGEAMVCTSDFIW
jgi:tRNA(Ile)-lysidine synthase